MFHLLLCRAAAPPNHWSVNLEVLVEKTIGFVVGRGAAARLRYATPNPAVSRSELCLRRNGCPNAVS